jgi:hypothetical protein
MRTLTVCWSLQPPAYRDINPPWAQTPYILAPGPLSLCGALDTLVLQANFSSGSALFADDWLRSLRHILDRCEDSLLAVLQQRQVRRVLIGPYDGLLARSFNDIEESILKRMFPRLLQHGLMRIYGDEPEWDRILGECCTCSPGFHF